MSTCRVTIMTEKLEELDAAARRALEKTAEVIHTQVVQAQVMPFGRTEVNKNGKVIHQGGHLQNDSTFVDTSADAQGHVDLVSSTPYARRLYYHPEYSFNREENPNAGAAWFAPWAEGGEHENVAAETFAVLFRREAGL